MIRAAIISTLCAAPVSVQAETFVSLAVDRSALVHGFGIADLPHVAQDAAMAACAERGAKCKVRYTRSDTCVAMAADFQTGNWGSHRGATVAEASANVLNHCMTKFNDDKPCSLVEVRCASQEMENS